MADRTPPGFVGQLWQARHLYTVIPLFAVGTGALYPLIALELSAGGHGAALIGAVTSAWYLGAFVGAALSGPVLSRLGYRRAFVWLALLAAASVWGLTLTTSPAIWLILRFLGGLGLGTYYLLIESWLSAGATSATRGRMLAAYEAIRVGAVAVGPLLLIVVSTHTAMALIGATFLVAIVPVAKARPPAATFQPVKWRDALSLFVCSPCTLSLAVVAGLLASSFYGLGAIYAEGLGFAKPEIALFVSLTLLAPVLSQLPVGAIADAYGRAPTGALIAAAAAVGAVVLALDVPGSFVSVTAVGVLVAGLSHPLYALSLGRLVDGGHSPIAATTAGLIGYNVGTMTGPLGAAAAMDYAGPAGLYGWVAACLVLAAGAAVPAILQSPRRCCAL